MTKAPCKRDCPERSATCRKTCEPWKKYEAAHAEERAEIAKIKAEERIQKSYLVDLHDKKAIYAHKTRRK